MRRLSIILVLAACAPRAADPRVTESPSDALQGRWRIELQLNSASPLTPPPRARRAAGTLAIRPGRPPAYVGGESDSTVRFGRYQIDLAPFFGGPVAPDVSTTVSGNPDTAFTTELLAWRGGRDSVTLDFIPAISHGGLTLEGRLRGDTVRGRWVVRAYAGGAEGRFVMVRESRDAGEVPLPTPPAPPRPVDPATLGSLRVRLRDEAAGRYFITTFELRLPDGSVMSANMRTGSGPDGWGTVVSRLPGEYEVRVWRFECGGKFFALRRPLRHPVTIRRGDTARVSLSVNVPALEIAPTYDNRDSLPCRAGPSDMP